MLALPEETPAEAPGWVALHAAVTGRSPSRRSDGAGSAEGARVPLPQHQPQPVCSRLPVTQMAACGLRPRPCVRGPVGTNPESGQAGAREVRGRSEPNRRLQVSSQSSRGGPVRPTGRAFSSLFLNRPVSGSTVLCVPATLLGFWASRLPGHVSCGSCPSSSVAVSPSGVETESHCPYLCREQQ